MQVRQLVEGHARETVVLGMERHVPRHEAHRPAGMGGARVFQHVGDGRAAAMFRQQVKPQERLANERRHHPEPERQRRPRQTDRDQRVKRQQNPRLGPYRPVFADGQVGRVDAGEGIAPERDRHAPPVAPAAEVAQEGAPCLGARAGRKLRVAVGVVGELVMRKMVVAKPREGQHQGQADGMAHGVVQPRAAERRVMGAFMGKGEQEHGEDAKRQQRDPPARPAHQDGQGRERDQPKMPRQVQQPRAVRPFGQRRLAGGGQRGEGGLVVHLSPSGCRNRAWPVRTPRSETPG